MIHLAVWALVITALVGSALSNSGGANGDAGQGAAGASSSPRPVVLSAPLPMVVGEREGHHHQQHHRVCAHEAMLPQLQEMHRLREGYRRAGGGGGAEARSGQPGNAESSRRGALEGVQFSYNTSIRITPVYQLTALQSAEPQKASFIQNVLLPTATRYLSRILRLMWQSGVRHPDTGALLLERLCRRWEISAGQVFCLEFTDVCGEGSLPMYLYSEYTQCTAYPNRQCTTTPRGSGMLNSDYVLLVTATNSAACNNPTLRAYASHCILESQLDRPVAGSVNFCASRLVASTDPSVFDRQVITAVHEILHALGFSSSLFPYYRDAATNPRVPRTSDFPDNANLSSIVRSSSERGFDVTRIITPKVAEKAREQYACPSMTGMETENHGGEGTVGSHWEQRLMFGDVMTGVISTDQMVSNITLALLEDTGWYLPQYSKAGILRWGYHAGCNFVNLACTHSVANPMPAVFAPYYCRGDVDVYNITYQDETVAMNYKCTSDELSIGYCATCSGNELATGQCSSDGCRRVVGFSNGICTNSSQNGTLGEWGVRFSASSRCFGDGGADATLWTYEDAENVHLRFPTGANCFNQRCTRAANGTWTLEVEVGTGFWVKCVDNATVDAAGGALQAGRIGPCPVAATFCEWNSCPDNCNDNGKCKGGVCYCYPSYAGATCAARACVGTAADNCTAGAVCDTSSGLCVTSPSPPPPKSPPPPPKSPPPPPKSPPPPPSTPPPPTSLSPSPPPSPPPPGKSPPPPPPSPPRQSPPPLPSPPPPLQSPPPPRMPPPPPAILPPPPPPRKQPPPPPPPPPPPIAFPSPPPSGEAIYSVSGTIRFPMAAAFQVAGARDEFEAEFVRVMNAAVLARLARSSPTTKRRALLASVSVETIVEGITVSQNETLVEFMTVLHMSPPSPSDATRAEDVATFLGDTPQPVFAGNPIFTPLGPAQSADIMMVEGPPDGGKKKGLSSTLVAIIAAVGGAILLIVLTLCVCICFRGKVRKSSDARFDDTDLLREQAGQKVVPSAHLHAPLPINSPPGTPAAGGWAYPDVAPSPAAYDPKSRSKRAEPYLPMGDAAPDSPGPQVPANKGNPFPES
eukprot:jgi/Mesvir1/21477/Mv03929-RA.1